MKKILLFIMIAVGLSSCSDDDNGGSNFSDEGVVSLKVGGVTKTYNTISVIKDVWQDGNDQGTLLTVTASQNGSASEMVTFYVAVGDTGAGMIVALNYTADGHDYGQINELSSNVTTNSNHRVVANFVGSAYIDDQNGDFVSTDITDGNIDFTYE